MARMWIHSKPHGIWICLPPKILRIFPSPRIGYVGCIDARFDTGLYMRLAASRPDWHFVIVGPVTGTTPSIAFLKGLANVHFIGSRSRTELPAYLKHFDVCTIPYVCDKLAESIFPLKFFEYLSAGRPIVSTALPELIPYSRYVHVADTAQSFEDCIASSLENPLPTASEGLFGAKFLASKSESSLGDATAGSRNSSQLFGAPLIGMELGLKTPSKILLLPICGLGDAVAYLPYLKVTRARFPQAEIVVVVATAAAGALIKDNSSEVEIVVFNRGDQKHRITSLFELLLQIRRRKFDVVISGAHPNSFRVPLFALLSGARLRIGSDSEKLSFLYPPPDRCFHARALFGTLSKASQCRRRSGLRRGSEA